MNEIPDTELRQQFDAEIPLLTFGRRFQRPSDDFIRRIDANAPNKTIVLPVVVSVAARIRNFFELMYLPQPVVSVPLLLILGLLMAQAGLLLDDVGQASFFGEFLTGGKAFR